MRELSKGIEMVCVLVRVTLVTHIVCIHHNSIKLYT